ncbi:hypothetical protein E8E11_001275 [Didymella keratinophila]|nr:hypothetical protein E8E11_001275 [Didymella keratinophila]
MRPPNYNITYSNNTNFYWSDTFAASSGTDPNEAPDSYEWICSGLSLDHQQHCANEVEQIKKSPDTWSMKAFAVTLLVIISLLIWGTRAIIEKSAVGSNAIFALGFGAVDTRALITGDSFPTDMISLVLIANMPQVILSFLYFAYNGMFTAMLLGYEWTSYAYKRKGLRISHVPSGLQRSTYFLQLPYRFGTPLVILSGTLHWLVSQSIFLVSLDEYNQYGRYTDSSNSCGYSPIAMLVVVLLGVFMVATLVGFGYIPYKSSMPLAGSCSLAISAACHPDEATKGDTFAMSEEKLQWGVVGTSADGIGHCAFSSKDVGPLVEGRMYA